MPGQPSYFKMDGVYTRLYPYPSNFKIGVELPQDIAPKDYTQGQIIQFEIDTTRFPGVDPQAIKNTKFYWKFGDGAIAEGLKNNHAYQQQGNYVLKILADDGKTPTPQLFESVAIKILPKPAKESSNSLYIIFGLLTGVLLVVFTLKKLR